MFCGFLELVFEQVEVRGVVEGRRERVEGGRRVGGDGFADEDGVFLFYAYYFIAALLHHIIINQHNPFQRQNNTFLYIFTPPFPAFSQSLHPHHYTHTDITQSSIIITRLI